MAGIQDWQRACAAQLETHDIDLDTLRSASRDLRRDFRDFVDDLPQDASTKKQRMAAAARYHQLRKDCHFLSWILRDRQSESRRGVVMSLRRSEKNLDTAYRKFKNQYGSWAKRTAHEATQVTARDGGD